MEHIINWILTNKEWLFSGLGITLIAFVAKNILTKNNRSENKQIQSLTNSQTQNVTVNFAQHSVASDKFNVAVNEGSTMLSIDGIRAQTNILFIDDDKDFKIVPILKKSGWKNTSFFPNADVKDTNAEKIRKAHIIFVDIKGVGRTMYEDEGLGLVVDLKKKYPQKKVVIYSAISEHKLFHEAIKLADNHISKNSQPAVFVSLIESLAENIWKNE